jgi:hypothetical protein
MVATKSSRSIVPLAAQMVADAEARQLTDRRRVRCIIVSLIIHELVLLCFAWLVLPPRPRHVVHMQVALAAAETEPLATIVEIRPTRLADPVGQALLPAAVTMEATVDQAPEVPAPQAGFSGNPPAIVPETTTSAIAPPIDLTVSIAPPGGGLEGRQADARARLVVERGGSPASELAVERGLAWLAAHQHADGGWRFDLDSGPCAGRCRHGGNDKSTTAATALALLPFLGAGETPLTGPHGPVVADGLAYLRSRAIASPHGADLQEGSLYGQGLAAIALSEAAAMTGDPDLKAAAQAAIDFIVHAQHPRGGWRYYPGQPGDTTVVGWQWMALKSGQMAGLDVPPETLERAGEFLDSVQSDDGAAYGYQRGDARPTSTAIGLLCRMYSGWRRYDTRLVRGIERLAERGPSYDDMYFNYYAAQVLHHQDGKHWPAWNEQLRKHLVQSQATRDHEAGSWQFNDRHTAPGGRLCDTALAVMILEVYYRYLPLYGWQSVEF